LANQITLDGLPVLGTFAGFRTPVLNAISVLAGAAVQTVHRRIATQGALPIFGAVHQMMIVVVNAISATKTLHPSVDEAFSLSTAVLAPRTIAGSIALHTSALKTTLTGYLVSQTAVASV
jgi:hypothetical protein